MHRQGLCLAPDLPQTKDDLNRLIYQLGFVQIDSIRTVERAHHMVLFARNVNYQREHLRQLQEDDHQLFEHWTHDASIVPTQFYPHWKHRFEMAERRLKDRWEKSQAMKNIVGEGKNGEGVDDKTLSFDNLMAKVRSHVKSNGPTLSRDLKPKRQSSEQTKKNTQGWWDWHPSKTALEYLWRTGDLSVARRDGFQKVYDLSTRVIPDQHRRKKAQSKRSYIDWACNNALDRLGFASAAELAAFWESIKSADAKAWCERELKNNLIEVLVEGADGSSKPAFARRGLLEQVDNIADAPDRLRVLSPFDPVIRDRKRLQRLFDFDYRIEIFFPEAKREYGYYVFPLLEKDRLIGRIDMKAERKEKILQVKALWLEAGVKFTKKRQQRLAAELTRHAKFVDMKQVNYDSDYVKT